MNLKTTRDNYDISILNEDIIQIRDSEKTIWDLHYANNIFDLFKNVKERTLIFQELFSLYQHHNENYKNLSEELIEKYPEIFQVVFKNNYHKVIEAFEKLSNLLEQQLTSLNVSENLLDENQRVQILNGVKIREDQSEFTSLIFILLDSLKGAEEITDVKKIEENDEKFSDKKADEIENGENDNGETILNETTKEKEENSLEESIQKPEESQVSLENNQKKVFEENFEDIGSLEKDDVSIEDVKEIGDFQKKDVEVEEVDDINNEVKREKEKYEVEQENVENQEPVSSKVDKEEKINELVIKYLAYQDSSELNDEEKKDVYNKALKSNAARKYAKILLELEESQELEIYEMLSKKIFTDTLINLQNYDIEPEKFTYSTSWAVWDVAKQLYYMKNPSKTTSDYKLADPLYSQEKQQEIKDRHIGWIVYKQMTTGRLDDILNKVKNSVYGKRIIEYMISKPKPGLDSLSSYKLAKLGECVRLGLEENYN